VVQTYISRIKRSALRYGLLIKELQTIRLIFLDVFLAQEIESYENKKERLR